MTLGLALFTLFHVVISLVGIAAGFVVAYGFVTNKRLDRWNALFLVATSGTSVSGFGFPFTRFLPSHALGILSIAVLVVAVYAWFWRNITSAWRPTYVVTTLIAQYFNVFVLVVQSFAKIPILKAIAPTQTEAPFALTQLAVLVAFVVLGVFAIWRSRSEQPEPAASQTIQRRQRAALTGSSSGHYSLSS